MSATTEASQAHAHPPAAEDHPEHAEQDDHDDEPPLPEPESPAWLPLLGGALFLLALLMFMLTRPDEEELAPLDDAAAEAPAPAAVAPGAEPNPPPNPGARPAANRPAVGVPPALRRIMPARNLPAEPAAP